MPSAPRSTALLVRISDDRNEATGVQRQEKDCRALAGRLGWPVGEVFIENDTSAYKRRKVTLADGSTVLRVHRPEFHRMLAAVTSGKHDAVIVYDIDRVARDMRDLEDLIDVVESTSTRVPNRAVTGSLDLSTDAGVAMARVMVAMNNKSSRDTARRVRRQQQEAREAGRAHGGPRPFGFDRPAPGVLVPNPVEADLVREAVARIRGGDSLTAIARDFADRAIPTSRGGKWAATNLKSALLRPQVAGLHAYARDDRRRPIPTGLDTEGIVPLADWEEMVAILDAPGRKATPGPKRKHLLSGLVFCGTCGERLVIKAMDNAARSDSPALGCRKMLMRDAQHVTRKTAILDNIVTEAVLTWLAEFNFQRVSGSSRLADLVRERDGLVTRLDAYLVAAADYTPEEMLKITGGLKARLAKVEADILSAQQQGALAPFIGSDGRRRWEEASFPQRRRVLDLLIDRIVLHPGGARGRNAQQDVSKVEMHWRGGGVVLDVRDPQEWVRVAVAVAQDDDAAAARVGAALDMGAVVPDRGWGTWPGLEDPDDDCPAAMVIGPGSGHHSG